MADAPPLPPDPLESRPLLIGMVHLGPTPGAPDYDDSQDWLVRALEDAVTLAAAGFHAVLVENFGDAPFFPERVPAETVAALTLATGAAADALSDDVAIGVNVLRNDAESALAIAATTLAAFIRVNVLHGAYLTDQGIIAGRAAEVARMRARLAPHVQIFADLRVKHAQPLVARPLEEEARELVERAGADAVIVSGSATGAPVDREELAAVRAAIGEHLLLIGSGATAENIAELLQHADGAIVGTALKRGGDVRMPVDPARAAAFVAAARG